MDDLFTAAQAQSNTLSPLADRMRPHTLDQFIGQRHIVGPGKLLRRAIEADRLTSSIFWGPPGCGKTTLASIIAESTSAEFVKLNAVTSGVGDVREVLKKAEDMQKMYSRATYLLLDECHRWSKSQSDSILPAIEKGTIRFIGSTTENPMIAMTPAIVSRCRLFRFEPLSRDDVKQAVMQAIRDEKNGYGAQDVSIDDDALEHIAQVANGDARSALNALELAVLTTPMDADGAIRVTLAIAEESIQARVLQMDETLYYDMLSAFCKSLRGSDSDAALAWFARLIYAGVDPRIIVRRIIAHASEDVGLANPNAMLTAVAAMRALEDIGMPEARLPIGQAIITVCESPKSNSVVTALDRAFANAEKGGFRPVPMHLRNALNERESASGVGVGYKYAHDYPGHYVRQQYLPDEARGTPYYVPSNEGFEKNIRDIRASRGIMDEPGNK